MIYIDTPRPTNFRRFAKTAHMMTDGDIQELHAFASKIGMKRDWFQDHPVHPHYDLFDGKIIKAIENGAKVVTPSILIHRCNRTTSPPAADAQDTPRQA